MPHAMTITPRMQTIHCIFLLAVESSRTARAPTTAAANRQEAERAHRKRGDNAGGTLRAKTDEYAHGLYYKDSDFDVVDRVTEIARERGVNNAQVALAWVLAQPGVTAPIIGASKLQHLEDALHALQVKLTPDEIRSLEEPYEPHPVLGHS
jgi:aryl-alcohol dehydrogenase-like predicted oxidoreductase